MAAGPDKNLTNALSDVFREEGYAGASLAQLAAAARLGKATLYHHFPGGKDAMAQAVLAAAIAELDRLAYRKLRKKGRPEERIAGFVDGFGRYVDHGERNCLLVALAGSGSPPEVRSRIQEQTESWLAELAAAFEDAGRSPKRAARHAADLTARLYGALALARLQGNPKVFRQAVKRLFTELSK